MSPPILYATIRVTQQTRFIIRRYQFTIIIIVVLLYREACHIQIKSIRFIRVEILRLWLSSAEVKQFFLYDFRYLRESRNHARWKSAIELF